MIIKIEKEKLIEPLKNLVGVAEKKQTMPILGNILFRAANGKLLIVGSDLEVEISTLVNHQTDEDLNTTLPGKKLLDILRSLPGDGAVTIELGDDKATIKSGKSRFVLASLPGSDFPYDKEDVDYCYEVSAHNLDNLINQTSFSMAVQDARHFLNGMFFEVGAEKITVVATDGHRLSMSACNQTNSLNEPVDCIIPRKCITEIKRILSDFKDSKEKLVNFNIKSNHFYFSVDDYFVKSKLIGDYQLYNISLALCIGNYFDIPKKKIQLAIESYVPTNNRSETRNTESNVIIMDAYNANPSSMKAMLESFANQDYKNKLCILGDMLEFGSYSDKEHNKILELCKRLNLESLFVGEKFRKSSKESFKNISDLKKFIKQHPIKNKRILLEKFIICICSARNKRRRGD